MKNPRGGDEANVKSNRIYISADPASPWPRQGGAWDHRRCGTLLSLKATVNCTTASDLLWASKTDGRIAPPSNPSGALAIASVLLCGSRLTDAPCPALKHCLWLLWCFQNWRMHDAFQNWRMAPCPDPKALPAPKSSLDWAAAGFSHAAAMVWWAFGWPPVWLYVISKLTDGPLSRSQSLPRAQELLGLSCGWL